RLQAQAHETVVTGIAGRGRVAGGPFAALEPGFGDQLKLSERRRTRGTATRCERHRQVDPRPALRVRGRRVVLLAGQGDTSGPGACMHVDEVVIPVLRISRL